MEKGRVLGKGYTGMKDYWKQWAQKEKGSEDTKIMLLAAIADALEDLVELQK